MYNKSKYFGGIAKYIYDSTLLEGSACSYKLDPSWILDIRVVDSKFVTCIFHKVDGFNFEVINYPFPQSYIHPMVGYTIIRFFRLCNNSNDFLLREYLAIPSWSNVFRCIAFCFNILKIICLTYEID